MASISLLHDIPVRPRVQDTEYYETMTKIFKMREQFGMKQAQKLFYWNNQEYVGVTPEKCYATLFSHPGKNVLAFVSNLSREQQTVEVKLNLARLGLEGKALKAIDPLTGKAVEISADGKIAVPRASEDWVYLWISNK